LLIVVSVLIDNFKRR